jgi:hypothetical protein
MSKEKLILDSPAMYYRELGIDAFVYAGAMAKIAVEQTNPSGAGKIGGFVPWPRSKYQQVISVEADVRLVLPGGVEAVTQTYLLEDKSKTKATFFGDKTLADLPSARKKVFELLALHSRRFVTDLYGGKPRSSGI